ncbi:MAG: retroviral-like aspartic protease family protein, partial [Hydrogenophaga sp.]|uniref:retroviral-like aspartic protease family protein n=1 Tax=Hydrogenophaga sp. TaxID=1904254 RepID=UPI00262249D0
MKTVEAIKMTNGRRKLTALKANISIRGCRMQAVLDTGAPISMISKTTLEALQDAVFNANEDDIQLLPWSSTDRICAAEGSIFDCLGMIQERVNLAGVKESISMMVAVGLVNDVILGMDALTKFGTVINIPKSTVTLKGGKKIKFNLHHSQENNDQQQQSKEQRRKEELTETVAAIVMQQTTRIPARSWKWVTGEMRRYKSSSSSSSNSVQSNNKQEKQAQQQHQERESTPKETSKAVASEEQIIIQDALYRE